MDLRIFSQLNFLSVIKALSKDLKVPMNYVADEPTTAKEILKDTYKENESFQLMTVVYFVGMVDAAFEGNKPLEPEEIKSDYDRFLIFGVSLKNRSNGLLHTRWIFRTCCALYRNQVLAKIHHILNKINVIPADTDLLYSTT